MPDPDPPVPRPPDAPGGPPVKDPPAEPPPSRPVGDPPRPHPGKSADPAS